MQSSSISGDRVLFSSGALNLGCPEYQDDQNYIRDVPISTWSSFLLSSSISFDKENVISSPAGERRRRGSSKMKLKLNGWNVDNSSGGVILHTRMYMYNVHE